MEFAGFNWVDWAMIGLIGLSTLVGVIRGFVREGLSLVVWILAFLLSFTLSNKVADMLVKHIPNSYVRYGIAFAGIFIATLVIGGFINFMISQAVKKTGLGGTDRLLGIIFGVARGILVIAIVLLLAYKTPAINQQWWKGSKLIPHFKWLVTWIESKLPASIKQHLQPTENNAAEQLNGFKDEVSSDINAPSTTAPPLEIESAASEDATSSAKSNAVATPPAATSEATSEPVQITPAGN